MYVEINKYMYSIKQAVIISYNQFVKHMYGYGYYPIPCNAGLWAHCILETKFFLCVYNFGVEYFSADKAYHILNGLKKHYTVSTD